MTDLAHQPPAVLLAGDSTVAAMPPGETPMSGWGAHLGAPLNTLVTHRLIAAGLPPVTVPVLNVAKGGATTESHRDEWLWDALLLASRPGDVVVLQFGHNDQKRPHLAASAGYRANLARMVSEARERGLHPVLCTPVQRRTFEAGRLRPTHGDHPDAVRGLSAELGVPCIDLTASTTGLYEDLGPEGSAVLFTHSRPGENPLYPDGIADDTHFSFTGATRVARVVAEGLAGLVVDLLTAQDPA